MYSHMDFSPGSGKLLASIGGNPDYMLTVWDWKREHIVLRSKAFSQDIYRVSFSPENPGQLTTSGTGHIRYNACSVLYRCTLVWSLVQGGGESWVPISS